MVESIWLSAWLEVVVGRRDELARVREVVVGRRDEPEGPSEVVGGEGDEQANLEGF